MLASPLNCKHQDRKDTTHANKRGQRSRCIPRTDRCLCADGCERLGLKRCRLQFGREPGGARPLCCRWVCIAVITGMLSAAQLAMNAEMSSPQVHDSSVDLTWLLTCEANAIRDFGFKLDREEFRDAGSSIHVRASGRFCTQRPIDFAACRAWYEKCRPRFCQSRTAAYAFQLTLTNLVSRVALRPCQQGKRSVPTACFFKPLA